MLLWLDWNAQRVFLGWLRLGPWWNAHRMLSHFGDSWLNPDPILVILNLIQSFVRWLGSLLSIDTVSCVSACAESDPNLSYFTVDAIWCKHFISVGNHHFEFFRGSSWMTSPINDHLNLCGAISRTLTFFRLGTQWFYGWFLLNLDLGCLHNYLVGVVEWGVWDQLRLYDFSDGMVFRVIDTLSHPLLHM